MMLSEWIHVAHCSVLLTLLCVQSCELACIFLMAVAVMVVAVTMVATFVEAIVDTAFTAAHTLSRCCMAMYTTCTVAHAVTIAATHLVGWCRTVGTNSDLTELACIPIVTYAVSNMLVAILRSVIASSATGKAPPPAND